MIGRDRGVTMPLVVTVEIARLVRLLQRTGRVVAWKLQVVRIRKVLPETSRRSGQDREAGTP